MNATTTTPHFTLKTVETNATTWMLDDRGERHRVDLIIFDLIACDAASGRTFIYVGPAAHALDTRDDCLDLIGRIFAWECHTGRAFDPAGRVGRWLEIEPAPGSPAARALGENPESSPEDC
jgi:hypothetical protein